eukprot:m.209946 g.209946  ORF g.209946 m.209946 type:complete len:642 (+) comp33057_c0_seq4:601-2526(+)
MPALTLVGDPHTLAAAIAVGCITVISMTVLVLLCTKRQVETQQPHFEPGNVTFATKKDKVLIIGQDDNSTIYDDQPVQTDAPDDWTKSINGDAIGGSKNDVLPAEPSVAKKTKRKSKKKSTPTPLSPPAEGFGNELSKQESNDGFGFDEALPSLPPSPKLPPPKTTDDPDAFGFEVTVNNIDANGGYSTMPSLPKSPEPAAMRERAPTLSTPIRGSALSPEADEDEDDNTEEELIPAWYAGKMSRKNCTEAVTAAANGDFLIRESSSGDRCVICINDRGNPINLVINVTAEGKYRFAGRERESLHDVVYFLRKSPLVAKDNQSVQLGKAAPKAAAVEKQQQEDLDANEGQATIRAERERKLQFMQRADQVKSGSMPKDSAAENFGGLVISFDGNELYGDVQTVGGDLEGFDDPEEEEPLYVDMADANVPSYDWIAEQEEIARQEDAGRLRVSNEEFGKIRAQARERAATAALMNRKLIMEKVRKQSVRRRWKNVGGPTPTPTLENEAPSKPIHETEEEEDFFEYQNASSRDFGGYEEEDIYGDSVPRWFAPRLQRQKCEEIVMAAKNGTYLVRESSDGTKYIICVKHDDGIKNFQIHVRGPAQFEFSGRSYKTLEDVISSAQRHGIIKHKSKIPLSFIAEW